MSLSDGQRRAALRIVGSAVILGLLIWALPFGDLVAALRRVQFRVWPIAIGAYLVLHLIGVVKWRMLVNVAGADLSLGAATRAYYWGLFGNTFLPSVVGGDVVKIGTAIRSVKSVSGLILGSFLDRLLDVAGLVIIAGAGALLAPRALEGGGQLFIGIGSAVAAAALLAIALLLVFPAGRLRFGIRRKLVSVRRSVRATAGRPLAPLAALGLGIVLQSLLVLLNYQLGLVIGIDIPLYVWLFAWPLAKISALLPVTQGGIGVREVAIAALLAPFGVSAANAVASGLVFEVVVIVGGLIGGLLVYLLGRSRTNA